jgi:uncharacterized membrane protein YqaE (UPF0057 family)
MSAPNHINASNWTFFDKILYGGLGYGAFCLPTDFFKVIIAILFPPLGEIINIVENSVKDSFPYFTWDTFHALCSYQSLNKIVYSFILTTLFYIPGLVYTLTNIIQKERIVSNNIYVAVDYVLRNPSRILNEDGEFLGIYNVNGQDYKYYMSNNKKIIYIYDTNNNLILILVANGSIYRVNKSGNMSPSTDSNNKDYFAGVGDKIIQGLSIAFVDKIGGGFEYAFADNLYGGRGGLKDIGEGAKKFFSGGYF